MCGTCGCAGEAAIVAGHGHEHGTATTGIRADGPSRWRSTSWPRTTGWRRSNRERFARRGIVALNLMSSPGSGKTTLLERTVRELGATCRCPCWRATRRRCSTPTGSAQRARASCRSTPAPAATSTRTMVARALPALAPADGSVVFVENVGNLVCPALFDLGERRGW